MMTLTSMPNSSRETFSRNLALWSKTCNDWDSRPALRAEFRNDFTAFACYIASEAALRERAASRVLRHYSRRARAAV